jgi:hypothetical protein
MYVLKYRNPLGDDLFYYGHVYDSADGIWCKTGYLKNPDNANSSNLEKRWSDRAERADRDIRKRRTSSVVTPEGVAAVKEWFDKFSSPSPRSSGSQRGGR